MTGYTTDNYSDNIARVTASMKAFQNLYKQRARVAAEDEYMMPEQLTALAAASGRSRAASHILKAVKDYSWNSDHFFRELDRLMSAFIRDELSAESLSVIYAVQSTFRG